MSCRWTKHAELATEADTASVCRHKARRIVTESWQGEENRLHEKLEDVYKRMKRRAGAETEPSKMLLVEQERDKALLQIQEEAQRRAKQNQFSDTILRDLDDMGKALDQSRQVARRAKRQLAVKEAELERLIAEERALLTLVIEEGPSAFWVWVKKEIAEQGLQPCEEFEAGWLARLAEGEDLKATCSTSSDPHSDAACKKHVRCRGAPLNQDPQNHEILGLEHRKERSKGSRGKPSLLRMIISIVLQEGVGSVRYVLHKGPLVLPLAWICFWVRLSGRLTSQILDSVTATMGMTRSLRFLSNEDLREELLTSP